MGDAGKTCVQMSTIISSTGVRGGVSERAGSKLSGADADAALDNLHSDLLPRGEVVLLSWSRSTVHYDTAAIQRETRELRASLGEDQLVEAIGVAALANATVRLAMLHA